jgi:peptide chain release factor 2
MPVNYLAQIEHLQNKFKFIKNSLDLSALQSEINDLQKKSQEPSFWKNQEKAGQTSALLSKKQKLFDTINNVEREINDQIVLFNLLEEESGSGADFSEIDAKLIILDSLVSELEIHILLSGKYDDSFAIFTIRSGSGGVEAADWAKMLFRMYTMYFEKKNIEFSVLDISQEEHGGFKSVVFEVNDPYAYGKLKNEAGTHRLVRISPFDHQNRRHTSFAAVEVIPQLTDDSESIELNDSDLKIDRYRSSGPGGQSVNTTDSAVRITHIPTGIVVTIQNEKSQLKNMNTAVKVLKSKLLKIKLFNEKEEQKKLAGNIKASWGDQVRNYILNPFQLVKDVRTGVQTSDAESVLNGNLDEFINAEIKL